MSSKGYKDLDTNSLIASSSDIVSDIQLPIMFPINEVFSETKYRVLSLFSGCGGMDLGFEGGFYACKNSLPKKSVYIEKEINDKWVLLKKTNFQTVFANDILPEAKKVWVNYMRRFNYDQNIYRSESIVDLVKMERNNVSIFPKNIDVVTGGFPCQDFSVAGKRLGFNSNKDDMGRLSKQSRPTEESRGKLYYWMKQVIDITQPKIFIAENVKGLVNLGNVKDIIQRDFASAGENGYIVLQPKVLNAGDFGVPESRERVIFIGIRRNALRKDALEALSGQFIPAEYDPYPIPTHSYTSRNKHLMRPVKIRDVFWSLKEPDMSDDITQRYYSKAKYLSNGSQGQIEIDMEGLAPTIRSEHHGNIEFRRLSKEHGGKQLKELDDGLKERRLTPRECALIQTFPFDYEFVLQNCMGGFYVSPSGAYKVIGNAVPPMLAFNIAIRIESLWKKYFK